MDRETPWTCPACGAAGAAEQSSCEQCGAPAGGQGAAPPRLTWEAAIPLLRSTVVLRQLAVVFFASCALVACFLLFLQAIDGLLTWESAWQIVRLFLIILGGFMLVSLLIMLVLYGNRYEYRFTIDEQGITATTIGGTRKKNTIVNVLLALSGRPAAAGAGLLAQSRQGERIGWKDIDNLTADGDRHEIVLRRRKRVVMLVQCTAQNYERVLQRIQQALG